MSRSNKAVNHSILSPTIMFSVALTVVALSFFTSEAVNAQAPTGTFPATPLAQKRFSYPTGIPEKVDTDVGLIRGSQYGYNKCGPETEGQDSKCQTAFVDSLDDFCLWGPPEPGMDVGSHEGEMVAWCTKPGKGTRLIPAGALTGLQFMKTPDYVQIVGFIDQTKINVLAGDFGGEMDPHGADLRGNPLGGLYFSNAWSGDKGKYDQAVEWHNFLGSNSFCLKLCDPSKPNAAHFCEHIYDRIGCAYNAPNAAQDKVFVSCEGENQDFPGTYTTNGQVMTYTQPAESLGAISTMPYTARIPASSNCVTFESSALFANLPTVTGGPSSSSTSSAAQTTSTGTTSGSPSTTGGARPTVTPGTTGTNTATGAASTPTSAAMSIFVPGVSIMGVIFSALFFA